MLVCLCQDWNTFLLRFNELDFCVSENETIKHGLNESTTPESMVVTSGQARSITQAPVLLEDSGPINISVPITLTLDPQRPFGGYSRNLTHLYATVLGQQVGLSGEFSASLSVSFFLFVSRVVYYKDSTYLLYTNVIFSDLIHTGTHESMTVIRQHQTIILSPDVDSDNKCLELYLKMDSPWMIYWKKEQ